MFDLSATVTTPIRKEDGIHKIAVRQPTDEEWVERTRGWLINVQKLGRGVSETDVDSLKADAKLYELIRQEGSPDLVPEEASAVIEALAKCDITRVKLDLDQGTVAMTVLGGAKTTHTLRLPTSAEVRQFQRASVRMIDMPHGKQQLRTNMQAALTLYNQCAISSEGYKNGMPAVHRDGAIRAVIDAAAREAEAPADEDF